LRRQNGSERVLIVEDDRSVRGATRRPLAAWMLGYDTPLTALDKGLGALGVSAAWLGDADESVNYGDEYGRAAGRVVGHVLAWRAAFRRRPRRLQLVLAVEPPLVSISSHAHMLLFDNGGLMQT
jgi:hypothetical protein